ncbi:MAG: glycogen synthase GlgA [Planctomycetaceae bacterium]|nr:glycogen synthase GlgA [Planctomycetaceae bacterium]
MNILLATSEAVPFAKTGGLADVCGALPIEIARLGHEVAVVMPAFRQTFQAGQSIEPTGVELSIPIGRKTVAGTVLRSHLPGSDVPVYLIDQPGYFDRPGLYQQDGKDYIDNCERFVFFSRAVLEIIEQLQLPVDIVHANDWQTGLVPAYLKLEYAGVPRYEHIRSILTIHNMAYQGNFWHWDMLLTGLDWKYFNWQQMEFFGNLNLLKTGLVFADYLTTVSPRYAQEIQTPEHGCGLEGVLSQRRHALTGIINGVDYRQWNPATDQHLAAQYDAGNFRQGKPVCKQALQAELGLPQEADTPLIGFVGRLVDQKGLDLITQLLKDTLATNHVQWAILGTGEAKYHELLPTLAARFPHRLATRLEFSDALAHRIEAGADIFMMPSRFEPCGLNQLYSLRYGTVPLVRATGGLADSITNATAENLAAGTANGFSFQTYSTAALGETLDRALAAYREPATWQKIVKTGMTQDWSWARSARQYIDLYEEALHAPELSRT